MSPARVFAARSVGGAALCALFLFGLVLTSAPVAAQALPGAVRPLTLEQLAPADAFLFASFSGIRHCSQAAEELGLYQLWCEPDVQDFVRNMVTSYTDLAAQIPEAELEQWNQAKRLLGGRLSLAVAGLTQVWTRDGPIPVPGMVLALDVTGQEQEARQVFEMLLDRFGPEMPGMQRSSFTHGSHEITVLEQTNRYAPRLSLCCAFVENLFLVGLNRPLLARCLDNLGAENAGTLSQLPAFKRARSKVTGTALMEAFVNIDPFTARIRGFMPEEWLQELHRLGLDSINALYLASGTDGGLGADTLYIDAPEPRRGLLAMGEGRHLSPQAFRLIPETAVLAFAFSLNPTELWDQLWACAANILPARERGKMQDGLAMAEGQLGLRVRQDVLEAFGHEVVLFAEMSRTLGLPNVVVSLQVANQEKATMVIDHLLEMSGLEVTERTMDEWTVKSILLPGEISIGGGSGLRPSLSMVMTEDRILLALNRLSLRPALRRLQTTESRCLADTANFKEAMQGLRLEKAGYFHYIDVKRLASMGYGFVSSIAGSLDSEGLPIDLAMLPPEEVVLPHIQSWGAVGSSDADGFVCHSRAVGIGSVLALLSRAIDRAPGIPPMVVERMLRSARRGGGDSGGAAAAPGGMAPVKGGDAPEVNETIINPLQPGDPREAELRERLGQLDKALRQEPEAGQLFMQRGLVRIQLRLFEEGLQDYLRARELGTNTTTCAYNIACCLSLLGRTEEGLKWLQTALEEGFSSWHHLDNDSDLDTLRKDPRFDTLVARFRTK